MIEEHRVIRVVGRSLDDGMVEMRAAIEDRFHNFRVSALLGPDTVERMTIEPLRYPYTMCPAAGGRMNLLSGLPLSSRFTDYLRQIDARQQCTHQFDVAVFAVSLGARGIMRRDYHVHVIEHDEVAIEAYLSRDGKPCQELRCEGNEIVYPPRLSGLSIATGFTNWTAHHLDPDEAEAVLVARRMIFIGRDSKQATSRERENQAPPFGGCWVQQPENCDSAKRLKDRILPRGTLPDLLTRGDDAYLEFAETARLDAASTT